MSGWRVAMFALNQSWLLRTFLPKAFNAAARVVSLIWLQWSSVLSSRQSPSFELRMSLKIETFSGMAVAGALMRSVADCLTRWNFFGRNWIFVQTREWSESQSALWYALVVRMLLRCSRLEMMRSSWCQFLDLGSILESHTVYNLTTYPNLPNVGTSQVRFPSRSSKPTREAYSSDYTQ